MPMSPAHGRRTCSKMELAAKTDTPGDHQFTEGVASASPKMCCGVGHLGLREPVAVRRAPVEAALETAGLWVSAAHPPGLWVPQLCTGHQKWGTAEAFLHTRPPV